MRFQVASIDHAKTKAKLLKSLLESVGVEAGLTPCQATVARCMGYASWAEVKSAQGRTPSPLDEDAGIEVWRARIARQCQVVEEDFDLDPHVAAGVALALRLTSRARSEDREADIARFEPKGLKAIPAPVEPEKPEPVEVADFVASAAEVSVWVIQWTEHERGWGCRPDGYSVHPTPFAAVDYVRAYWARMPKDAPDEFSKPETDAVQIRLPPDHPVAAMVADGRSNRVFGGKEEDAVRSVWPSKAGSWQSVRP